MRSEEVCARCSRWIWSQLCGEWIGTGRTGLSGDQLGGKCSDLNKRWCWLGPEWKHWGERENVEHSKGSHVGNKYLTLELLTWAAGWDCYFLRKKKITAWLGKEETFGRACQQMPSRPLAEPECKQSAPGGFAILITCPLSVPASVSVVITSICNALLCWLMFTLVFLTIRL